MTPAAFIACARAVGDPTRLRMIHHLDRPLCVGQLAATVGVTSSATTYHLKLMSAAGLVVTERRGRTTVVRRIERRWEAIFRAIATAE